MTPITGFRLYPVTAAGRMRLIAEFDAADESAAEAEYAVSPMLAFDDADDGRTEVQG